MDRNVLTREKLGHHAGSLSARRAWIEIVLPGFAKRLKTVALRKESVDRNTYAENMTDTKRVALRKESVDRNLVNLVDCRSIVASLSARRAWIEIKTRSQPGKPRACRSPQGERG